MTTKQIAILRAGPPASRGPKAPDITPPFVIEVEIAGSIIVAR
jgi:hypothetical protein